MVLPKWGLKEVQPTLYFLFAFVPADEILFCCNTKPQYFFINLASVVGRRFSNSLTSAIPVRCGNVANSY